MLPTDYECLMACKLVTILQGTSWSRGGSAAASVPTSTLTETREVDFFIEKFQELGWQLVTTSERERIDASGEFGYMGAYFVNAEKKLILIAHRGTQFVEAGNIIACLAILQQAVPDMLLKCAMPFVEHVHAFNQDKNFNIVQTGFSLGGFLAEAAGACSAHRWRHTAYTHNRVICFDSPGADTAIQLLAAQEGDYQGMAPNKQDTVIYVAFPNIVNTATPHHGEVRQIKKYYGQRLSKFDAQVKEGVYLSFTDDGFKTEGILFDTIKTHHQDALRKLLLPEKPYFDYVQVAAWPLARNELVMADFSESPDMLPLRNKVVAALPPIATYDAYQKLKTNFAGHFAFRITFDTQKKQGAIGVIHKVDRSVIQYSMPIAEDQQSLIRQSKLLMATTNIFSSREDILIGIGGTLQRKEAAYDGVRRHI